MSSRILAAPLAAAMMALSGCSDEPPAPPPVRMVLIATAQPATGAAATLPAILVPKAEADVGFRVGGRIVERRVALGDRVRRGQVLATIDPSDLRLAADAVAAQIAEAGAETRDAELAYGRTRTLAEAGYAAKAALDAADARLTAARARQVAAQRRAAQARNDVAYAALTALDDGVVAAVLADAGAVVSAGQPVFRVARAGAVEAEANVPEALVSSLREGMAARVALTVGGVSVGGRIREIAASADPATRTFRVRVALPSGAALRLGQTAQVSFAAAVGESATDTGAVAVPLHAVVRADGPPRVWVVAPSGDRAAPRPVRLVRIDGDRALVEGLDAGARVVASGASRMTDRTRIRAWRGELP